MNAKRRLWVAAGLLVAVLLWGVVEGCSYLAYGIIFKESCAREAVVEQQLRAAGLAATALTTAGKADCIIHPYYGYAHNGNFQAATPPRYEADSAAEFGFYDPRTLTPFDREAKYFIAVTGGSVAHLFASQGRDALLRHVARLPQAQGKELVFFDLANWGYKQPQQLLILSDLLHRGVSFDLLLNIDGYNELALAAANIQAGVSPFFPTQWNTVADAMPAKEVVEAYGQAAMLQRWREAVAQRFLDWPHDPFLDLIWRLLDVSLAKAIVNYRTVIAPEKVSVPGDAIRLSDNGRIMLGPNRQQDPVAFSDLAASSWARASALMASLVQASGGVYVHVLQPNQYVPGSKAMGDQERAVAYLEDSPNRPLVERGYPLLRSAGEALRGEGVLFLDMSMVFGAVAEPLYEDSCCHFNTKGNELLANAIGQALADAAKTGGPVFAGLGQSLQRRGIYDKARFETEAKLDFDLVAQEIPPGGKLAGLGDIERHGEALWRLGMGPATTVSFPLPGALPVVLRYALASPFEGQGVTVLLNGREVDTQTDIAGTDQLVAPPASLERELRLSGRGGVNVLEFRYRWANGGEKVVNPEETRPLAVIFRQLRVTVEPGSRPAAQIDAEPAAQP